MCAARVRAWPPPACVPVHATSPRAPGPPSALRDVRKVHGRGDAAVVALDGVSVGLATGSFTAIMGPSGSGKSTFLNVAAGLDQPTSGTVMLGDTDLAGLNERRLTILQRDRIGFVFQAFNLLPSLTVAQNIGLPLRLDGRRAKRSVVREVAARVGLEKRLRHRPSQLSGGQQQRVAIARALVPAPRWCSRTSRPERSTRARGVEAQKRVVQAGVAFPADAEPAEVVQPGERSFRHPAHAAESRAAVGAAAGDHRLHASAPQLATVLVVVMAAIGDHK